MASVKSDPKAFTTRGRLSFPRFKHAEAVAFAQKSEFDAKKAPEEINSSFSLLLEQDQVDKFVAHVRDVFLPFCKEQHKKGETKKDGAIDDKYIAKIEAWLDAADYTDAPPHMPLKALNPKYADQTPECVARLELKGPKGGDIRLKARVEGPEHMSVPDDALDYPALVPLSSSIFTMYPGAVVAATINLYSYFRSNTIYGVGAGVSTAVYMGNFEGEPLGGGTDVNEEDIFAD